MTRRKGKPSVKWSDIKQRLKTWGRPEVIGLVQELFEFSAENREFLATRLLRDSGPVDPIRSYRRKIIAAITKSEGFPDLAAARKAIRDYEKSSDDLCGTLDLMLIYIEIGTEYTCEFGDMYAGFYDSLCSVMDSLSRKLASKDGREHLERFRNRLLALAKNANGIGWGYGDQIVGTVRRVISDSD